MGRAQRGNNDCCGELPTACGKQSIISDAFLPPVAARRSPQASSHAQLRVCPAGFVDRRLLNPALRHGHLPRRMKSQISLPSASSGVLNW